MHRKTGWVERIRRTLIDNGVAAVAVLAFATLIIGVVLPPLSESGRWIVAACFILGCAAVAALGIQSAIRARRVMAAERADRKAVMAELASLREEIRGSRQHRAQSAADAVRELAARKNGVAR